MNGDHMLKRTPEPELMTEAEQAKAYAEADFETAHNHCVDLLHKLLGDLPKEGVALDLGCGPGDVTVRVARSLPHWKFVGVDGSDAMLAHGGALIAKHSSDDDDANKDGDKGMPGAPLKDRIRLLKAYLPLDPIEGGPFDLVFSNSLLHHLVDPGVLWQSVKAYAPPGTPVFVMDLMRPDSASRVEEMVDLYAKDEPEILRRDFLYSLHAAYTIDEVKTQLRLAGLSGFTTKAVSDRHFVVYGNMPAID